MGFYGKVSLVKHGSVRDRMTSNRPSIHRPARQDLHAAVLNCCSLICAVLATGLVPMKKQARKYLRQSGAAARIRVKLNPLQREPTEACMTVLMLTRLPHAAGPFPA
jgi:hypothetical protein